jgi:hypothetical protein
VIKRSATEWVLWLLLSGSALRAIFRLEPDAQQSQRWDEIRLTLERDGPTGLESPGIDGPVIDRQAFRAGQARMVEDAIDREAVIERLAKPAALFLLFGPRGVGARFRPR